MGLGGHADIVQHLADARVDPPLVFPSGRAEDEFEVILDGAVHQQLEILENDAELAPQVGDVFAAQGAQVIPANGPFAGKEVVFGRDGPDDGGLAGADLAHDVDEVAGEDVHVEPVDDGVLAAADVGISEGYERLCVLHGDFLAVEHTKIPKKMLFL